MSPKGVEHIKLPVVAADTAAVNSSMSPKGVEHMTGEVVTDYHTG